MDAVNITWAWQTFKKVNCYCAIRTKLTQNCAARTVLKLYEGIKKQSYLVTILEELRRFSE